MRAGYVRQHTLLAYAAHTLRMRQHTSAYGRRMRTLHAYAAHTLRMRHANCSWICLMREGLLSGISIVRTSAYATHVEHTLRICLMREGLLSSLSIVACSIGELRSMNKSFRSSCIRQHTSAYVSIRQTHAASASCAL
jgi:hypothetical protein